MQKPAYLALVAILLAAAPCHAGKPIVRDGSTMEKAIRLKQRGTRAIEEEMAWMMKLHHYTPLLSTRDAFAEAVRQIKVQKKKEGNAPQAWSHGTLEHDGQWCSYWWFRTPRGRKEIYFDTGVSINTPGEVARQESSRADYMQRMARSLKLE
jgi:hypothetical protein